MSYKLYITEEEFDRLNWHGQRDFLYCLECGLFYNKSELQHGCNHGIHEGGVHFVNTGNDDRSNNRS